MDLEKEASSSGTVVIESSIEEIEEVEKNSGGSSSGAIRAPPISEAMPLPYVGMEFESEDDAREFYIEYARRSGFMVRLMHRRLLDGKTIARRLGCNKQGFTRSRKLTTAPDKKPRPPAREGCNAAISVKIGKNGKWVVSTFEPRHNHPLLVTGNGISLAVSKTKPSPRYHGDKDKKIELLTKELQRYERLCRLRREKLFEFMNTIEEQNEEQSLKIQAIIDKVRRAESELQKHPQHR